ncbi:mediator of RNA polymerase II transcription subunit 15-like protein [Leptotrombidium deliense]|uniref:Mediator of RNA polymerase II transcription subunit 15-like protein n=1 Tax=Leptotrombidium deliense TaxID=299467 RepID=A0A443SW71_9ACAR|nr:mediator of RNA polymerase II transcription subunit 15-like protein [Leptotrombidium deliense]
MRSTLVSSTLIVATVHLIPFVCGQYVFTYEVPENKAPQSDLFDVSKYKVNSPSEIPNSNSQSSNRGSGTIVPDDLPYRPAPDRESPAPVQSIAYRPPERIYPLQNVPYRPPEGETPVSPVSGETQQLPPPQTQPSTRPLTPAEEEEGRRSLETLQQYINEQSQLGYLRPRFPDQRGYGDPRNYRGVDYPGFNPLLGPPPNRPPPFQRLPFPQELPSNRPYDGPPIPPQYLAERLPPAQPLPQPPFQPQQPATGIPTQEFHVNAPNYNPNNVELKAIERRPPQRQPAPNTPSPPTQSTYSPTQQPPVSTTRQALPNEFNSPLLNSFLSQYGSYAHRPPTTPSPATSAPPPQLQEPYVFQPNYGTPAVPIHPEPHNNVVLRVIQRRPVNATQSPQQPYFQPNYNPYVGSGYPPNVVLRVVQRRPVPQYTPDPNNGLQATPDSPKFQTSQEAIRNLREKQLIEQFAKMNTPNNTQYGQPSYNQETSVLPGHRFTRVPQTYRQAYRGPPQDVLLRQAHQERPRHTRPNRPLPEYTRPNRPPPEYTRPNRPPPEYTQPQRPRYNPEPQQHYPQDVINREPTAVFETAKVPYEATRYNYKKEENYNVPSTANDFNKNRFKQQLQRNPEPTQPIREQFTPSLQLTTKRPRSTTTFKPAHLAIAALPPDSDNDGIPGIAGKDYPNLERVPKTSFSCAKQPIGGYFADTETACQAVHICRSGGLQDSFLCPNGTIFNQEKFACAWWYEANCGTAASFYSLNDNLYRKSNDDRNKKSAAK